jgi:hypothetical protein
MGMTDGVSNSIRWVTHISSTVHRAWGEDIGKVIVTVIPRMGHHQPCIRREARQGRNHISNSNVRINHINLSFFLVIIPGLQVKSRIVD